MSNQEIPLVKLIKYLNKIYINIKNSCFFILIILYNVRLYNIKLYFITRIFKFSNEI